MEKQSEYVQTLPRNRSSCTLCIIRGDDEANRTTPRILLRCGKHHFWHQARIFCVKPTDDFFFVGFSITDKLVRKRSFEREKKFQPATPTLVVQSQTAHHQQVNLSHAGYTTLDISMVYLGLGNIK